MSAPLVSVLMPVYNCGPFVDEAVQCILNQTFGDFDFLIVDDASTDDTWERLQKHSDPRIRLSRNAANKGLAQNLNDLLAVARGEFIARMDGDDACLPERFELQVRYLQDHPACGAVGSYTIAMDAAGHDLYARVHPLEDAAILQAMMRRRPSVLHATTIIRRVALASIGGYRPTTGIVEDFDMFLRLHERYFLGNVPRFLYRYRQHGGRVGERRAEQNSLAVFVTMLGLERRRFGADSLQQMKQTDLDAIRKGKAPLPRLGTVREKCTIVSELTALTNEASFPMAAFRVALAAVRKWPLAIGTYVTVLRLVASPVTYRRTCRCLRNSLGRHVHRLLRLR